MDGRVNNGGYAALLRVKRSAQAGALIAQKKVFCIGNIRSYKQQMWQY